MLLEMQALVEPRMREATLALMQGLCMEELEQLCGSPFSRKGEHGQYSLFPSRNESEAPVTNP